MTSESIQLTTESGNTNEEVLLLLPRPKLIRCDFHGRVMMKAASVIQLAWKRYETRKYSILAENYKNDENWRKFEIEEEKFYAYYTQMNYCGDKGYYCPDKMCEDCNMSNYGTSRAWKY